MTIPLQSRFYAGIGSRSTPTDIAVLMEEIAAFLALKGWTLRTGLAEGADQAFWRGAKGGVAEVYLPCTQLPSDPWMESRRSRAIRNVLDS